MTKLASEKTEKCVKTFPSAIPGAWVRVRIVCATNDQIILAARAVDSDTGEIISAIPKSRHILRSNAQLDEEARAMVGRVEARYFKSKPRAQSKVVGKLPSGPFVKAYLAIDDPHSLCDPTWASSTMSGALSDLQYVLGQMDSLDEALSIGDADMQVIHMNMVERALANAKSSKNLETVTKGINSRLGRAGIAYANLRVRTALFPMPDVRFPKSNNVSGIQPEQCKALPDEVRIKFAALLLRLIHKGCVLGAALMLTNGLRPAEAGGPCFGDFRTDGGCVSLPVLSQMGRDGVVTDRLKTEASYRLAPVPVFTQELVRMRKAHLFSLGYDEEAILKMPLVSSDTNPADTATPGALSAFIKTLLTKCGITNEILMAAQALQVGEADTDAEGKHMDVAAYLLRRDFATRACNICGFEPHDVDYLLGHKNKANDGRDYQTPQAQRRLAGLLENYVLHPEYTAHPDFRPIEVPPKEPIALEKATRCTIAAQEDLTIHLHLECCEPGSTIALGSESRVTLSEPHQHYHVDSAEKRNGRTILGLLPPREKICEWMRQTEEIDLSAFDKNDNRKGKKDG